MMREVKYRGITANGDFVYGWVSYDLPNSTAYYKDYSQRICWHPESGGSANVAVKNGTVGQYTGLKDANGKKIYEGDIVEWVDARPKNYKVDFIEGAFCLTNNREEGYPIDINMVYPSIGCRVKLIGNIYENPELMEVQDEQD